MIPYERVLGDAIRGGPRLFVREDGVEAAWGVVDPFLGKVEPVHEYESNSWGLQRLIRSVRATVAGAILSRP